MFAPAARFSGLLGLIEIVTSSGSVEPALLTCMFGYCARTAGGSRKHSRKTKGINVLVAPTWGPTNILAVCGHDLIEILLREGYKVTLRLHPESVKRNEWVDPTGSGATVVETSVINIDSLLEADILITDWSGIGLEYAFGTERPVIFINTPPKVRNPKYKELGIAPIESYLRDKIGTVVSPDKLDIIPSVIDRLLENREMYREQLVELRGSYVFNFGTSSKVGADYIRGLVA